MVAAVTRHIGPRGFPRAYGTRHPHVTVVPAFADRPCTGPAPLMSPLPVGVNGVPWNGMDPSDPISWVRPWNPAPGMIAYLNFDGAKAQAAGPTQVSRPLPQSDVPVRRRVQATGGRG